MIRKNLTFLILKHASNKNAHVCRSPFSLHFFSTRIQTQLNINPTVVDILIRKYDFPSEFSFRVASELGVVKNPEKVDSTLSFFKSTGFSNAQLQKILSYTPKVLRFSLEDNIKPKIKIFQDEGFSSDDICLVISRNASILEINLQHNITPSLSLLRGLLGSTNDLIKAVKLCPRLMTVNLHNTVVANVEFLKNCGVAMDRIRIIFKFHPDALYKKPAFIRSSAEKAKEMGIDAASKAFIYAVPTIASMRSEAWEAKLQLFRDMGFSDCNITAMFRKSPKAFCGSVEKLKTIVEALLATGRFDISTIADHPIVLTYSFEKRYKPRMRVLELLESRSLIESWPALRMLSSSSDAEFLDRFVQPYLDDGSGDKSLENLLQELGSFGMHSRCG